MDVYLDNSATTKPSAACVEKITHLLTKAWGNPSSLHTLGFEAERALEQARAAAAARLSCRPEEIIFTSGGTESNNLAVFGAAAARSRRGNRIVTTALEHPSVLQAVKQLEQEGLEVVYLKPDRGGQISPEQIFQAVSKETILVSMMAVNNEVGTVLPLEAAADAIAAAGAPALFHVDAVQAFGKMDLKPARLRIDLMSVSAHKVHGPKGAGALYRSKSARIVPRTFGGGQESGMRPGTEATPLIAGFGAAISALPNPEQALSHVAQLNRRCREGLSALPEVSILSPQDAFPYILSLSAGRIRAESMLHFLASRRVFVSSGSACSKGKDSPVLAAMGVPRPQIQSALRVSFCHENTAADVDAFLNALEAGLRTLAHA